MFRLPKRFKRRDRAAIMSYIGDLWQEVHDAVDQDEDGDDEWCWIYINPLLDEERGYVDDHGAFHPNPEDASDITHLPDVPEHLESLLGQLCDSMRVTSPPVQRAQHQYLRNPRIISKCPQPGPKTQIRRKGITMEDFGRLSSNSWLWSEKTFWNHDRQDHKGYCYTCKSLDYDSDMTEPEEE